MPHVIVWFAKRRESEREKRKLLDSSHKVCTSPDCVTWQYVMSCKERVHRDDHRPLDLMVWQSTTSQSATCCLSICRDKENISKLIPVADQVLHPFDFPKIATCPMQNIRLKIVPH